MLARSVRDLTVYKAAMDAAMRIHEVSKRLPAHERYCLTDQVRRSSRSVCANLAEAWRKRRYPAHFVSKLSDAEAEAEETRVWIEFARRCGYIDATTAAGLDAAYDQILAQLSTMSASPERWRPR